MIYLELYEIFYYLSKMPYQYATLSHIFKDRDRQINESEIGDCDIKIEKTGV